MIPETNTPPRCPYPVFNRAGERVCGRLLSRPVRVTIDGVRNTEYPPTCTRHSKVSRHDPAYVDEWTEYDALHVLASEQYIVEWKESIQRGRAERRADEEYQRRQMEGQPTPDPYGGVQRERFYDLYNAIVRVAVPAHDLAPSQLFSASEIERRVAVHDVLARQLGRLLNVKVNSPRPGGRHVRRQSARAAHRRRPSPARAGGPRRRNHRMYFSDRDGHQESLSRAGATSL